MSEIVQDGAMVEVDWLDQKLMTFDWGTLHLAAGVAIASSTFRINALKPKGVSVSSITRSGTTATATTAAAHGYTTGDWVAVEGAAQADYNITAQVTVTGTTTFTYTVANSPPTPATGTITVASGLGKDSESIGAADKLLRDGTTALANRYTEVRLIGAGVATSLGRRFEVSNKIVTNETPTQTKDRSFFVVIVDR